MFAYFTAMRWFSTTMDILFVVFSTVVSVIVVFYGKESSYAGLYAMHVLYFSRGGIFVFSIIYLIKSGVYYISILRFPYNYNDTNKTRMFQASEASHALAIR